MQFANYNVELAPGSVSPDARFYRNRWDMISSIGSKSAVCEVGVAWGDFSLHLIRSTRCDIFHAVDTFQLHTVRNVWGENTSDRLLGLTHKDYYANRIQQNTTGDPFKYYIHDGFSHDMANNIENSTLDLVYIDADHSFDSVSRDVNAYLPKLAVGGYFIFNDYTIRPPIGEESYGVVPVVNALCNTGLFQVKSFALEKEFFCDIALQMKEQF